MASRLSLNLLLTVFLALGGCEKLSSPSDPSAITVDLTRIAYVQTGFASYEVRYSPDSTFNSLDILAITVGLVDSGTYVVQDSIPSSFDPTTELFTANFNATVTFSYELPSISVRVRYYRSADSWTDIDTTLSTLKFPYPSTEVLWDTRQYGFEDLDILGTTIVGLQNFQFVLYDLETGQTSKRNVPCYEALAIVEGRYIYYDHINWSLYRYDLVEDTSVLFVPHPMDWDYLTMGLEVQDSVIWELLLIHPNTYLFKYAMETGEVLDSILMPRGVSRMTIHENVAYFETYLVRAEIKRFDLSSKSFLAPLQTPSPGGEGIRIRDGFFYFSSFSKRVVGRIPLTDLLTDGLFPANARVDEVLETLPKRGGAEQRRDIRDALW